MQKEYLYGIIGLLLGVVITVFVASNAVNNNDTNTMRMMGMNTSGMMGNGKQQMMGQDGGKMGMGSSMDDMMESLQGKTGEEFDKSFMDSMMIHHQGAIEMAREAKANSKRPEIMKMADDIISAQTSEINMMKEWQKQWGY